MTTSDVAIIGGGLVGLATSFRLLQHRPGLDVAVLEKEPSVARHQSGRNSGVLHSGIYYEPGSLKATTCRKGKAAMESFCREEGIPYETCGKVIVATAEDEIPRLERLYERGQANGVRCERIGPERLREIEPHAAGIRAIHVPETGVLDYGQVANRLAARIREMGAVVHTGVRVDGLTSVGGATILRAGGETVETARTVVNCAGLHSDRVAELAGSELDVRIVPFRGEYYQLTSEAESLCRGLIYPVPDPSFPFLGVHFTRTVDGRVKCGPNAVLAFAREGYSRTDVDLKDVLDTVTYPGFWKLAADYWHTGAAEMWRSLSKETFVRSLQKLIPAVRSEHLEPAPAGVRAQAVRTDGDLVDDFVIDEVGRVINVCNAPSPAATSSLAIGEAIAEQVLPKVNLVEA